MQARTGQDSQDQAAMIINLALALVCELLNLQVPERAAGDAVGLAGLGAAQ